jgi:hypothetical protein
MKAGRLQSVKDGKDRRRHLIVGRSVRIKPLRLPELHRLIDQIRPWYTKDTIDSLCQIVAAAEARLSGGA